MSDDSVVRRVHVTEGAYYRDGVCDHPEGTHALAPWEEWESRLKAAGMVGRTVRDLTAENERLREALMEIASDACCCSIDPFSGITTHQCAICRALAETEADEEVNGE